MADSIGKEQRKLTSPCGWFTSPALFKNCSDVTKEREQVEEQVQCKSAALLLHSRPLRNVRGFEILCQSSLKGSNLSPDCSPADCLQVRSVCCNHTWRPSNEDRTPTTPLHPGAIFFFQSRVVVVEKSLFFLLSKFGYRLKKNADEDKYFEDEICPSFAATCPWQTHQNVWHFNGRCVAYEYWFSWFHSECSAGGCCFVILEKWFSCCECGDDLRDSSQTRNLCVLFNMIEPED